MNRNHSKNRERIFVATLLGTLVTLTALATDNNTAISATGDTQATITAPPIPPVDEVLSVSYRIDYIDPIVHRVTHADSVAAIVALISFEPKQPCMCDHVEELVLEYSDRKCRFSICSHCLNYAVGHEPWQWFEMPEKLWETLQELRVATPVETVD